MSTDPRIEAAARAVFVWKHHIDDKYHDEVWELLPDPDPEGDKDEIPNWPSEAQYLSYITDHGRDYWRSMAKVALDAAGGVS